MHDGLLWEIIQENNTFTTSLDKCFCHGQSQASSTACYNECFAGQVEIGESLGADFGPLGQPGDICPRLPRCCKVSAVKLKSCDRLA